MAKQSFVEMIQVLSSKVQSNPVKCDLFNKCKDQKGFEEIFSCLWDFDEAHEALTLTLVTSGKSEVKADALRNEGNDYYRKKHFEKALKQYNLSIMAAPHPVINDAAPASSEPANEDECFVLPLIDPVRYGGTADTKSKALAMAYANRSAVMFELNIYEKCLRDINLALEYGYPEEKCGKLDARKQKCLAAQNNSDIQEKISSLTSPQCEQLFETPSFKSHLPSPKLTEPNPAIPSISSAIKVGFTNAKGRGLIAVRNIRPGEILGVERAYSVSLESDNLSTFCCRCLEKCLTPLPCPSCSEVIFCSELCRRRGLAEDHWIDCAILPSLRAIKMPDTNFPHKLLKTFSHNQLNVILNQLQKETFDHPENMGCDTKGIYDSSSYRTVHHLSTNKEHQSYSEMFIYVLNSFIITKLLQLSGRYFMDDHGKSITPTRKDLVTTGAVLLAHTLMLKTSAHGILVSFQTTDSVGTGMFPAISLINHSCNHSAYHYFCGRELVLRAKRPIRAGEEVTDAYTSLFYIEGPEVRKDHLKDFHINCDCEACQNQWPTLSDLPEYHFRCIKCQEASKMEYHLCTKCKKVNKRNSQKSMDKDWQRIFKEVVQAEELIKEKECNFFKDRWISKEDMTIICDLVEMLHKYLIMPCQCLCLVERTLMLCSETVV